MNLNDYVYRTIIKTEIYSYCFKLLRVFFLLFFFLHALQGERIKDIKKKRCSLATLFTFEKKITIVIVDYYSHNFGKL